VSKLKEWSGWFIVALMWVGIGAIPCVYAEDAPAPKVPVVLEPLKTKIGNHYAFKGTVLSFRVEETLTEEQWQGIESLRLRLISTGGKGLDDSAIERLAKLDPEGLVLDGSGITDDGFKYIATMKSLRSLSIGHIIRKEFTGAGFAMLKDLPKLEKLSFGGSGTRESAMNAIGELTQLKEFSSWHTQNGDPTNPYLLKLIHLESLTIGNSLKRWDGKPRQLCLTDASLPTLAQMTSLQSLTLMQSRLSYSALLQLKMLTNLKKLRFDGVDLSAEEIEKLRAELPGVTITGKALNDEARKQLDDFLK